MSQSETLSPEKRAQILGGAARVFARDGYEGASMSRIAAEAGVSKGTLYNYFESKADMFGAWVSEECALKLAHLFDEAGASDDTEAALNSLGIRIVGMMLSETGQAMYRLVLSEAGKFPELTRIFYDAGPCVALGTLAARLAVETERGRLAIPDLDFAAEQFFTLCQTRIVMRRRLHLREEPSDAEIAWVVGECVAMFLARYGV